MSVVRFDESTTKRGWSQREKRATQHKVPGSVTSPVIDYEKLRQLCSIEGLSDVNSGPSSKEAHETFMANYRQMFVQDKPTHGLPIHSLNRSQQKDRASQMSFTSTASKSVMPGTGSVEKSTTESTVEEESHDIRDHLAHLHKQRRSEDPRAVRAQRIRTLRKLLKKLPFERSASDNDEIFNAAKHIEQLACQAGPEMLKELCVVAQLDVWKEPDITLFGNTGFHVILRGKVQTQSKPHLKLRGIDMDIRSPTPELEEEEVQELGVGDCFGTLEKVEGRDPNSRILTVITKDSCCEFLKITTSDFQRVMEQIRQRDETEKVNLLQSCDTYKLWSKQPLIKVAALIEWLTFPANTVLVSEGYTAPFLAIIKTGECHVLRHVEVLRPLPNGKKEKQTKQVVMGKLGACSSFGEISVLKDEPITCSIVTATNVNLACIEPSKLKDLDEVTLQLLEQSSERTFGNLTQDDIHQEYVQQELKREWNEFKHNIVVDAINAKGIRPGYGKWAK